MRSRLLSTFSLIGFVLIALGIVGLAMGSRFVFDPGQTRDGYEPIYYLIVGALMIVNGIFTPVNANEQSSQDSNGSQKNESASGSDA